MNKLYILLSPLFVLALIGALNCSAQRIDPITQAVLNGYTEILKDNPKDYETLYERASQYQQLGMSSNALEDVKMALSVTPKKNTAMLESEYILMAAAATSLKDYDTALSAVNEALAINPGNYSNIYRKGNILLEMNRPEDAYRAFSSLQSLKSRSQEAFYGMALSCIRQNNFSEAETLMNEVEKADPTNPITFSRLGNLFMEMNQPENASANYIVAITLDSQGNTGMQQLADLALTNYNAVASTLDFAIDKSDNKPMMYFLKGTLANRAGAYPDAEDCFNKLISISNTGSPGIYAALAEARLAQNELPDAMEAVNEALRLDPSASNYTLKSEIELAMQNTHGAIADASEAIRLNPNFTQAYLCGAKARINAGEAEKAMELLNQTVMMAPDNLEALLLRAYVNQEINNNPKVALGDLNRIIQEEANSFPAIAIQAIARAKANKQIDADAQMEDALNKNKSPEALYWGAVYYTQTGDSEKGKKLADDAVYEGFLNKHMLTTSSTPWLNLTPIADLLK